MDQYIGKMLDNRYEILEVIGAGGMAVVYRAYCHRLKRFVAVKILKRELAADAEFRRRFHEEAQAVAMLSHPNIVAVYDISRGDELDYIVMELIEGITLKQYMEKKKGVIGWRESLYFITQIVRALGHAHSRGIIHRDIKPQNIMVLRDGTVKVADFGIARIVSAAQKTMTQEVLGSVHYISPEQARGSHIDARADIYSAGVVLYEMLTGRLPFDGDTPVAVALQHINATPLSPTEINPEIPVGLEEITMKAMASRIDQRYANAEAMLRDLEEFRKNPRVVFDYNLASFHGTQPSPDEPTRKLSDTGELNRQRARARTQQQPRRRPPPERERDYEEDDDEPKRSLVIPIVVVVFLLGIALFLWLAFFSGLFNRAEEFEVPNLIGLNIDAVYRDDELQEKFRIERQPDEQAEGFQPGQVIRQDPNSDTMAEEGSTIKVWVCGDEEEPEEIEMIDVKGYKQQDAINALRDIGLEVDEPETETSDDVEKGKVISHSPSEGTKMQPGDKVHLVVSEGPAPVVVPTVIGSSINNARKLLSEAGLTVSSVVEEESDSPKGEVIRQSLNYVEVPKGTGVALTVSKGPKQEEPPPEPEPPTPQRRNVEVAIPQDGRESVQVRITVDGVEKYSQHVNTDRESLTVTVEGTGKNQEVVTYIDGTETNRGMVDFE